AARVFEPVELNATAAELIAAPGPSFLLVKVAPEADGVAPRVPHEPEWIAERVRRTITGAK
ncbi:MAG TPA: sulfopyruvate decarboxylase subunit beta, partial [Blastocatellia bacterium]|nr:sulfopyruvate decarboxylase subunit beta [Blastocatellia bacterium]